MKFKMSEKSLFATLLRAPWWVSFVVMFGVALVAGALLPEAYKTAGMLGAFPFFVIGTMAAWRQRNALSADQIQALAEQARGMGWREFSAFLENAWQQQGYQVTRLTHPAADFQLQKNERITLVCAKRWKAATLGIDPLRDLQALRQAQQTDHAVCISLGQITPQAQEYAADQGISLLTHTEWAQLRTRKP